MRVRNRTVYNYIGYYLWWYGRYPVNIFITREFFIASSKSYNFIKLYCSGSVKLCDVDGFTNKSYLIKFLSPLCDDSLDKIDTNRRRFDFPSENVPFYMVLN